MALPKQVKKDINPYPVVKNQEWYTAGNPVTPIPKRREQLLEFIQEDGTFLPKSVLHEDLDSGLLDFVQQNFKMSLNGNEVPIIGQILTIQRWGEFTNTWKFVDGDKNITLPFIVAIRRPDVQFGSNPSLRYNIPDRRTFHYAKVPTWDGQRKGMDVYKIPQPVPVDLFYEIKIVCNRMRELNLFSKIMMQTFSSRQAYTFIKGHYVPIVLDGISDESQITDLEKRKYYQQSYTLNLQGFLIDEEEFEIKPAINRAITFIEPDIKTRRSARRFEEENPDEIEFIYSFKEGTFVVDHTFNYDVDFSEEKIVNIDTSAFSNGVRFILAPGGVGGAEVQEPVQVSRGDKLTILITKIDNTKPASVILNGKIK